MIEALQRFFQVDSPFELAWVGIGLFGQLLFSARFILQWIASERSRQSVIPVAFWYFSLGGGAVLLAYAIHRQDPVFILGQSLGVVIYGRNLWLIRAAAREPEPAEVHPPDPVWRVVLAVALALAATIAVFSLVPGLDLAVSRAFYDPVTGFAGPWPAFLELVRQLVRQVSTLVFLAALGVLLWALLSKQQVLGAPTRLWALIPALYLLGTGLLVEVILKPVWGRVRPDGLADFGGQGEFTTILETGGACLRNCSFSSGEVAGATVLGLSLVLYRRLARPGVDLGPLWAWGAVAALLPLFVGLQRVSSGRHFLSDAAFSVVLMLLLAVAFWRLAAWIESPGLRLPAKPDGLAEPASRAAEAERLPG
jgi:lipid A 4'-phosphatase